MLIVSVNHGCCCKHHQTEFRLMEQELELELELEVKQKLVGEYMNAILQQ